MARVFRLTASNDGIKHALTRSLQSAHINYVIGAGASFPAVPVAGSVEQEIATLYDNNQEQEGRERMYGFLAGVQQPTNDLIAGAGNAQNTETIKNYVDYIGIIEVILTERRTNLLPKQATVFSTNYDLFVEKAALNYFIHRLINDGDLKTIASAVSYIDRVMQDSIPTLPTGTCIFSGVATQIPLKINVRELEEHRQPKSETRKFSVMVPDAAAPPAAPAAGG